MDNYTQVNQREQSLIYCYDQLKHTTELLHFHVKSLAPLHVSQHGFSKIAVYIHMTVR